MLYSSAEKESRLTARRGSQPRGQTDREKIALDITVLKKQYDKLRERQKQAHIILSSAVSKQQQQQQQQNTTSGPSISNVNRFLAGKNAIVSKGRKGPPKGAIPPARNQRTSKSSKPLQKTEETTMQWRNIEEAKRRNSVTWKEINSERRKEELKKSSSATDLNSPSKRRSDSSSYSEESDNESSPSTSLCDEDANVSSSREVSPLKKKRVKDLQISVTKPTLNHIIEEASPVVVSVENDDAKSNEDCSQFSITTDGWKSVSPNTRFYLELPTNFGDNITSTAQLSPLPDLSNYFTAISPIKTPCGFFELPEFNSFLLNNNEEDEKFEKYQVNDNGVTNEFFERCYEDNLTSSMIDKITSPSSENENKRKSFQMHQKSLSMDEKALSCENGLIVSINRSFSDGTVRDNIDDFQRIVAENSKMLNKLIPLVEESKSPNNLSDVEEEEIAAIDKSDETDEKEKEEIHCSDIQDIGNMEVLLRERILISSSSSIATTTTSTLTISNVKTTMMNEEEESNVTTMNVLTTEENNSSSKAAGKCGKLEKSMTTEDKNEASSSSSLSCAQATPILSSLERKNSAAFNDVEEKKIVEVENRGTESERCHPSGRGGDLRDNLESPKFNEIQLMVLKLKEEMESQMKSDNEEVKKEVEQKLIEELKEKIEIREIAEKIETEVEKGTKAGKVVQIAIIVESEDNEDGQVAEIDESPLEIEEGKPEKCSEKISEKKIDEKNENTTTPPNGDLENKIASKAQHKIDTNDDPSCMTTTTTTTVTTTKTACENCQRRQKEEGGKVEIEKNLDECHQKSKKSEKQTSNSTPKVVSVDTKVAPKSEKIVTVKKSEKSASPTPKKHAVTTAESEKKEKNVSKKHNEPIEILSRELSRYKFDESSRIIVQEKLDEKKNAILELAEMIKEREMEKMNEMKKLEKVIEHRTASISPARSCKSRSNCCSPTESMVSSSSRLYDHEPRSELRRRDIVSMENEHRSSKKSSIRSRPTSASPHHEHSPTSPTTSNIRDTLSSIQNTIKYLDSCCKHVKKEPTNVRSRRDKTPPRGRGYERVVDAFGNVICENDFNYVQPSRTRYHSSPPSYYDDDVSPMRMSTSSYEDNYYRDRHDSRLSRHSTFDDEDLRFGVVSPVRRRYDRSLSPVRNRYDYEDPLTISSSSYRRSDIPSVSPSRYFSRTPDVDSGFIHRIRGMSTNEYLATKRSPLGGSRERLNISRSPYASREALFVSKSPLGSRERLDIGGTGVYRSALGSSRDRLNALGSSRSTFDDSRDYLSTLKSSLGASRERLNILASVSKSPFTSTERLNSSKTSAFDSYDRYYTPSKKAFGSSDRLTDLSKSTLAGSRDRLDVSTKPLSSCLSTSREKLFDRSKSPANDNFEKFHPSKSPICTVTRDSLDSKYGIARSPTTPSISTTSHVSRAPTKSPVQTTTSYIAKCNSEERSSSKPLETVTSKFVRFDPIPKSRSPIYDTSSLANTPTPTPNTADFTNSTLVKSKAIDEDWKKSSTTTRKYDY
jgi:hypothetical protein